VSRSPRGGPNLPSLARRESYVPPRAMFTWRGFGEGRHDTIDCDIRCTFKLSPSFILLFAVATDSLGLSANLNPSLMVMTASMVMK